MLLRKCDEATQSIEVPSPETIDSEVRTYFNQQDKDWSPMLSDNDETNELVSKECLIPVQNGPIKTHPVPSRPI